jgi:hypothetical protein
MQQLLQRHRERWKKPIVNHRRELLLLLLQEMKPLLHKRAQTEHLKFNEQQKLLLQKQLQMPLLLQELHPTQPPLLLPQPPLELLQRLQVTQNQ